MKPDLKLIKKRAKYSALLLAFIGGAYLTGSFHPNQHTINKLESKIETKYATWADNLGLHEPAFEYTNDEQFTQALHKCIDYVNFKTPPNQRVPIEMIVGQAALESGWGTSRFATEGNNLFGIRTYDKKQPHLLPQGIKKWPGWGVKKFKTKCDGVKYFVNLLNNHRAYEKFRTTRDKMYALGQPLDPISLVKTLDKYSTTPDYADRVISIIERLRS